MTSEPENVTPAGDAPPPAASGGGSGLFNLARGAKGVALLLFLLPWVTISCAGQELATLSGYDLATGSVTIANPMTGASETPPGAGERDIAVIAAALLILLSLAATFVLKRGQAALVAAGGAAVSALLISYTVLIRVPARMRDSAAAEGSAGMNQQEIADMISVDVAIGFWLTLAVLIAAVALNWLARGRTSP
jgi:hypothetical protein